MRMREKESKREGKGKEIWRISPENLTSNQKSSKKREHRKINYSRKTTQDFPEQKHESRD